MPTRMNILVIDDDVEFLNDLEMYLSNDYDCHLAQDAQAGTRIIESKDIDVLLLDINLGSGTDGLTLLKQVKKTFPYLPVIMITGDERVSTVVTAMKLGASGYVGKKPDLDGLKVSLEKAMQDADLLKDRDLYRNEVNCLWKDIIGDSSAIRKVKEDIGRAAEVKCNVLITGESGTGKELVARAIHNSSPESHLPFVATNCAAIPKDLFESELFGHEKGAFTGAITKRIGRFEQARDGTIFLDEISEIPTDQQAKLLRVLQERKFYRVGGMQEITCRARVIASTNRALKQEVQKQRFREDLYYRLKVFEISVPPLRDRKVDIPDLVAFFLQKKSFEMKRQIPEISAEAISLLSNYPWPGNIRELENCVEGAIVRCSNNKIDVHLLGEYKRWDYDSYSSYEAAKKEHLERFQKEYIGRILKSTNGNVTQAAEIMGVSRQGLIKMMKSCGFSN